MKTVRLDMVMLLPDLPEGPDTRVDRLAAAVSAMAGVAECRGRDRGAGPVLLIRYDPGVLKEGQVERKAVEAARSLDSLAGRVWLSFSNALREGRDREIEAGLRRLEGVVSASVGMESGWVQVEYRRDITSVGQIMEFLRDAEVDLSNNPIAGANGPSVLNARGDSP